MLESVAIHRECHGQPSADHRHIVQLRVIEGRACSEDRLGSTAQVQV